MYVDRSTQEKLEDRIPHCAKASEHPSESQPSLHQRVVALALQRHESTGVALALDCRSPPPSRRSTRGRPAILSVTTPAASEA